METQNKIPTSKVARASKFFKAGVKMGGNYAAHYTKKAFGKDDKEELDRKNAEEIFNVLSQLKGTALKIAQMLSVDTGVLPKAYAEKFASAQNNAMRLSGPLMMNTFRKYMGKSPYDIYDVFNPEAIAAASIGQVHEAYKDGKRLAVKIQYPGVADSIQSDISMVKPFVLRYMGVSAAAVEQYVEEIVERLVEETDYVKELGNGKDAYEVAQNHPRIIVPQYYPELSNHRILTMDWLEGQSLNDFIKNETDQEKKNIIAQTLVDFFQDQIHSKRKFHADLHPGNFLVTDDLKLGVIDFGCSKVLSEDFYNYYFSLVKDEVLNDPEQLKKIFLYLDFIRETDTPDEERLYTDITLKIIELISRPLRADSFDFGDEQYNIDLQNFGEELNGNQDLKNDNAARGSQHALFLHRAFVGLFGIMYNLKATVHFDRSFANQLKIS
ncbi:MAG: AarF/ABC1/UbiB kinase family protein [Chitinophagales bacterium]|nr:AarF/ABC1/UbiB kinase family protein [Chitinophagales bacterium]